MADSEEPQAATAPSGAASAQNADDAAAAESAAGAAARERVTVRLGTFNINAKPARLDDGKLVDLGAWVGPEADADIRVFGFQELDDDPQTLMLNLASPKVEEWTAAIEESLPADAYARVAAHSMVGIVLVVYVKESLVKRVTNVLTAAVPTGMMGFGNKGGVGVRFDLDKTGFCFLCSHFAAHQGAVENRNADFRAVLQRAKFWREPAEAEGSVHVLQHERVVWLGDLNYRVDFERDKLMNLIGQKRYADLLAADQLCAERAKGHVFRGFEEPEITFAPTYKYDVGTDTFDTSPKQRLPAYCDRVLYMSADGDGIEPVAYVSHPSVRFSDHKPVTAVLRAALCADGELVERPAELVAVAQDARPASVGDAARGAVSSAGSAVGSLLGSLKSTGSGIWGQ